MKEWYKPQISMLQVQQTCSDLETPVFDDTPIFDNTPIINIEPSIITNSDEMSNWSLES